MRERIESSNDYRRIANAAALLLFGGLAGYIIAVEGGRPRPAPGAPPSAPAAEPGAVVDESQLHAYRDILARDPRNRQAAIGAGNLLYDAQRYQEAIGFYQQALAVEPSDISVSTDLGTALWYAGRADDALAQYERSLALNPAHAQTLLNVGIVRADGKHDYAGAIAAWETLLKTNPDYPAVARVQSLLADARAKTPSTR